MFKLEALEAGDKSIPPTLNRRFKRKKVLKNWGEVFVLLEAISLGRKVVPFPEIVIKENLIGSKVREVLH